MQRRANLIDLEALTADSQHADQSDTQNLLAQADVVYAVSGHEDRDIVVYGREKLQRIAESEIPEGARVVRVQLRSGATDLQSLLELVQQHKGRHQYAESA